MTNHDRINGVYNLLRYVMVPYYEAVYTDIAYVAYELRCLVWEGGDDTLARELIEGLVAFSAGVIFKLWSMYDKEENSLSDPTNPKVRLYTSGYLTNLWDSIVYLSESIQELKEEYGIS